MSQILMDAISLGDVDKVQELLSCDEVLQEIEWPKADHIYLCEAISRSHYDVAKLLLEKIFHINNKIQDHTTVPLHYAARNNSFEMVILLLLRDAKVNVQDEEGTTPLHFAVSLLNEEMVELLLGYKANPNIVDNVFGVSPFQLACMKGNAKIVKSFINHGCSINGIFTSPDSWECPKGSTPLHLSVLHKNLEVIKLLLNLNANVNDVNEDGESALHLACGESDEEIVELLISKNALINVFAKDNTTPLYYGIKTKNLKIVQLLLESGAFVEYDEIPASLNICKPIHTVIAAGCRKMIEILIKHGLDVNMKIEENLMEHPSFLHIAVKYDQLDIAKILLDKKADTQIKNDRGRTPLHIAVDRGNKDMIVLLLNYGADTTLLDKLSLTPFHIACSRKNVECVQLFLSIGVNVNAETEIGETSLHLACAVGNVQIVQLLLKSNILNDAKSVDGSTPLHIAVENGHKEIVELLITSGADAQIVNKDGKNALELAVEHQHAEIVERLLWYNHDSDNASNRKCFLKALLQYDRHGQRVFDSFLKYKFSIKAEDANKNEILFTAVKKGYYLIVEDIINYDVDLNNIQENGDPLLHVASKNGQHDIVNLLLKHGADLHAKNCNGETVMLCAVQNNDAELVETFIRHGVDIAQMPELLHTVIQNWKNNSIYMIDILLKHNLNINYCNRDGLNALHLILLLLEKENEFCNQWIDFVADIIDYLLSRGANVDAKTKLDSTALHMVVSINGDDSKIENLIGAILKHNPDVNSKDKTGCTPLHLAAQMGNCVMIAMLLNSGSDINITNDLGLTPLDCVLKEKSYYTSFLFHSPSYSVNSLFFKLAHYDEATNIMHAHIIKLKAANLLVDNNIENVLEYQQTKLYSDCEAELNVIKQIKISNCITLYDLLVKSITVLARYIRNQKVGDVLKFEKYKSKCPIYANLIYSQLRKAVKREQLLIKAKESIDVACKYCLNDLCAENIFIYLAYEDLYNLVTATRQQS